MKPFTIGKLADQSGVGVETVRFYERKGLIKKPPNKKGFREYHEDDAKRIRFIKRAQGLGFTLKEIKELLELNLNLHSTCGDIKQRADVKIKEVETKIVDLKKMKKSLSQLSAACGDGRQALVSCNILDCFKPECKC